MAAGDTLSLTHPRLGTLNVTLRILGLIGRIVAGVITVLLAFLVGGIAVMLLADATTGRSIDLIEVEAVTVAASFVTFLGVTTALSATRHIFSRRWILQVGAALYAAFSPILLVVLAALTGPGTATTTPREDDYFTHFFLTFLLLDVFVCIAAYKLVAARGTVNPSDRGSVPRSSSSNLTTERSEEPPTVVEFRSQIYE